jgi:hypothetical protein
MFTWFLADIMVIAGRSYGGLRLMFWWSSADVLLVFG